VVCFLLFLGGWVILLGILVILFILKWWVLTEVQDFYLRWVFDSEKEKPADVCTCFPCDIKRISGQELREEIFGSNPPDCQELCYCRSFGIQQRSYLSFLLFDIFCQTIPHLVICVTNATSMGRFTAVDIASIIGSVLYLANFLWICRSNLGWCGSKQK